MQPCTVRREIPRRSFLASLPRKMTLERPPPPAPPPLRRERGALLRHHTMFILVGVP